VILLTPENAALLDTEAISWGLSSFALVEAAGRVCAAILEKELTNNNAGHLLQGPIIVCAGSGNNGADALVLLRALLTNSAAATANLAEDSGFDGVTVVLSRFSDEEPRASAVKALQSMGIKISIWNGLEHSNSLFENAALIIDGICGTGIKGPLEGIPLEMVTAINKRSLSCKDASKIISIDVPSGAGSAWDAQMPIVHADYTLAIEPLKTSLYTPAIRPFCGKIIPVKGIFPRQLLSKYKDARLHCWEDQHTIIPPLAPDAFKYRRGVVEIHAGSCGCTGAARIAAAGASAAGAGLVRLIVDDSLYPVLAPAFGGIMAVPVSAWSAEVYADKNQIQDMRFKPNAVLLGPGWGRGTDRLDLLRNSIENEQPGRQLILDADAIVLLKMLYNADLPVFSQTAILTPHAGELEALSGIPKEQLLSKPACIAELARHMNAVILFKSHVMIVAGPDASLGFIDGMDPALGAGGSGDLLAGLCTGIAARINAAEKKPAVDPYDIAVAAGTLLIAASKTMGRRFYDPLELAQTAAKHAGEAWLP